MPQAHFIEVPKTARYYYLGSPGPHVQKLWYVIHGYGQLAGEFIKDFNRFQSTDIHLINGANDPIYKSRQFQQTLTTLQIHNIPHQLTTFEGQHQIKSTIVAKFK